MTLRASLSNPGKPDAAPVQVLFPIRDYENIYRTLAAAGMGDPVARDCRVAEIDGAYTVLGALKGQDVNIDELNYLAKRLESFGDPEVLQFEGAAAAKGITGIEDFINLTFCCRHVTVIADFSDLRAAGKEHYLNKNGGGAPVSEMKALDTEREARELIQNGKGVVTPYGVVYDNGMELAQFYGGKEFPEYLYDQCVLAVESKKTSDPEAESTWLYLPVPEVCVERALIRGGLRDCDELRLDMEVIDVSSDLFRWLDPASETVAELNGAAQAIQALDDDDLTKLCAVVEYAKPGSAKALKNLALNIGLFDFYPDVFTAKEYGRHIVTQSGHFRYDADLDEFYDFEGYGRRRLDHEQGAFVGAGYIRRKGFVSIEEAMADIWSGRAGQESPDNEPSPNIRMGGL